MTKSEYVQLYEKYHAGKCTEAEKRLFESYSDEFSLNASLWDTEVLGDEKAVNERMYKRLQAAIDRKPKLKLMTWIRFSAAAALLLISSWFVYDNIIHAPAALENQVAAVISPGTNKAFLTLADGSTILLDEASNGLVANQGKTKITRNKSGQIVYHVAAAGTATYGKQLSNRISTPRGAEAQILLPDGTKVWLNAESSIKFPTAFTGNTREVELSGEVYMEVAENKKSPFLALVGGTVVEVLGTHFNINAYGTQAGITTTLLEGSVKLKANGHEAMLKPGQEGVTTASGEPKVRAANLEDAVAWKNGLFVFQNESIYSIMHEVSRWYNVDVEYVGSMKGKEFEAKMDRSENITELLKNMELTGTIQFKIKGRRVIVMSK